MKLRMVRDAEEARARLAQVAPSGTERAAWAREHGISARSLNMWRLILEQRAQRPRPAVHLVELVPTHRPHPHARYVVRAGPWEVEVDEHVDAVVLRRILDAVAPC
jgi:hypothetical protein